MLEHCYFSLDQWEIKVHLLWGKWFNIPLWPFDQCDTATHWWPFWMQVKSRYGLVKLTYFGENCCCICEDGDKTKMGLTDNTLGIQLLARFKRSRKIDNNFHIMTSTQKNCCCYRLEVKLARRLPQVTWSWWSEATRWRCCSSTSCSSTSCSSSSCSCSRCFSNSALAQASQSRAALSHNRKLAIQKI